MSSLHLDFAHWRTLVQTSPESVVDQFLAKQQVLSKTERQACFAATPLKDELLNSLQAAASDAERPLAGVPYVIQDLFDVKNMPTGCGAPFTTPFEFPLDQSSLLHQQLTTQGACLFSKTIPAEFGVDPQGRNPTYGACKHRDGEQFVCGGGAGAAVRSVADGFVPLAFGLDTAGGIRIPAAFHGLFGFRMENNTYARDGVFPIAPSIESVGWVNNCIADLCSTFRAFYPVPNYQSNVAPRGTMISELSGRVSKDIKSGLLNLTHSLDICDDPEIGTGLRKTLAQAKVAYQTLEARELYSIHQYWIEEYQTRYDSSLLRRIKQGLACTPASADECSQIQETIRTALAEFFIDFDYLIVPISPIATPEKAVWSEHLEHDILELIAPASLAFLPALILPFKCELGLHSAAQVLINPRKLQIVPQLLAQLTKYYENQN